MALSFTRLPKMHMHRLFAKSALGLGLGLAMLGVSGTAQAQGELRLGMTAADIPTTRGAPDQGGEGIRWMGFTLYDSLVYWDLNQEKTIPKIVPALAEKYYPNPENDKEWIFELRHGVKFHDGSDFTTDAVIWNLEKLFDDKKPQFDPQQRGALAYRLAGVKNWRKIDDYKLAIGSDQPDASMLDEVVFLHISSPAQWKKLGGNWAEFSKQPSGTGPFKMQELVPRQRAVLVSNHDYWDKGRIPKLDRLILYPTPDASARVAGLLSGQLNFIEVPPSDALDKLKSERIEIRTNPYPHIWPYALRIAGDNTPMKDVRIRQALNLAINRDEIVQLLGGLAAPAYGLVVKDSPWFGNPSFKIRYDPDAAKKLLAEAGYGPSNPLKVRFMISPSGSGQMQPLPMNELIQEQLKAVGVQLDFEVVEWNALREQRSKGPLDAGARNIHGLNNSFGTSTFFDAFQRMYSCDAVPPAGLNWSGICDQKLQKMLVEASHNFDQDAQDKQIAAIHEYVVDNAFWIWVVHDVNPRALRPEVKGFSEAKSWYQDLTQVYIQK